MRLKKILKFITSILLIVLGLLVIIGDYGDFGVITATVMIIIGGALFLIKGEDLTPDGSDSQIELLDKTMATSNPIWESRGWLGAVAVLLFFVVIQASGAIANWTAPEKKMTEAEFLSMMENAKFIELRGQLGSSNDFTYIYVDDERVGTTKNKGWWNMKWPIINKGQNLYTLQYSDHKSNEEQFTSYEFVGIESGVLGYAQLITEDLHHMVYFYDKYDELVGYADIEPAWAGYRSEWTIWDPEGEPIYSLTADYNPLDRQLTHKIFKQKESDLNFFQAMWITYMTREDMKRYYKD